MLGLMLLGRICVYVQEDAMEDNTPSNIWQSWLDIRQESLYLATRVAG